ncbi:hypothetical protein QJS66_06040 [Kocuria rhizophila]|nr:hypothetical protein QJS66_06040 [Kocuria rhizophila]
MDFTDITSEQLHDTPAPPRGGARRPCSTARSGKRAPVDVSHGGPGERAHPRVHHPPRAVSIVALDQRYWCCRSTSTVTRCGCACDTPPASWTSPGRHRQRRQQDGASSRRRRRPAAPATTGGDGAVGGADVAADRRRRRRRRPRRQGAARTAPATGALCGLRTPWSARLSTPA